MKYVTLLLFFTTFHVFAQIPETDDLSSTPCGANEDAQRLAMLIVRDRQQQRQQIRCNALLSEVAAQKARTMAEYGIVRHNLGGSPNERLRQAGYALPSYYGNTMSNQVEAIAGGYTTAEDVWDAFKGSFLHRQHLLGEVDFYREQDEIGVGFYRENASAHVEYWVVYLAKGKSDNQGHSFAIIPNKGIDMLQPDLKPQQPDKQ